MRTKKKYFIVLDIETANDLIDNIAYDIGFAVADKKGNIYESHSYMVSEMFAPENLNLLNTAYYAEKIPNYWRDLLSGTRSMASIEEVRSALWDTMKRYNTLDVYAYNASFDRRGLNKTLRYLTKSADRWFFPYGTEFHCIWHMTCQTIAQQKNYFRFAQENGLVSDAGNLRTSAESIYKYISHDPNFEEEHTGLEDVYIETEILKKCFAQHKKIDTSIKHNPWQIPQKNFKNFLKSS